MPDTKRILEDIKPQLTLEQYQKLQTLAKRPREHLNRIPLLLPLLATFGLVATFYGFEKLLDRTDLINHPWELIGLGIALLLLTGAAARKL